MAAGLIIVGAERVAMSDKWIPKLGPGSYLLLIAACLLPLVIATSVTNSLVRDQRETLRRTEALNGEADLYDQLFLALRILVRQQGAAMSAGSSVNADTISNAAYHVTADAVRRQIPQRVLPERQPRVLAALARVDAIATTIASKGMLIDSAARRGEDRRASELLVEINADYDAARLLLTRLRRETRQHNVAALQSAVAAHDRVKTQERVVLTLSLLAILAITVYFRRSLLAEVARREAVRTVEELERRNFALEQAMDGIATFGANRKITWANSNFARIVGFEPDETVGLDIASRLENPAIADEMHRELVRTGRVERVLRLRRKDGSFMHAQAVVVQISAEEGGFLSIKDVTREQQSAAALRLAEERFGMAMLATRDVIADWNILEDRIWVNDALFTEFGYPDGVATVAGWIEAVHPEDRDGVLTRVNDLFATDADGWTSEYRFRRYDGTYAYVVERAYLVRDEHGLPIRLVGAMTDMTARKRAEEELARVSAQNRLILGAVADGIFGVDPDGNTTFVSPGAEEILGWTIEDLGGRRLHDVVHAPDACNESVDWADCSVRGALEGRTDHGSAVYARRDGSTVHVEFTSVPMLDANGAIAGAVVTFRDITERLAVQRMKDEFISVVSHELRTPLTSIRGALGLIHGGRAGEVPPKIGRMLEIAVSNTDRLIRLINDILDIERIDSGKVTLTQQLCDASELIGHAIETMKPLADQEGVRLIDASTEGALFADRDRLLQTLTNLIGNAIKFSPRDSSVTISAGVDGNDIRFTVADQGRGIPAEKIETIFERFQQVDASDSRQKGGSGLGLAISRSIVRQHGGEIHAESGDGEGSRFVFTIPRVQIGPSSSAAAARHRTLLVCDDDDIIRSVELELLQYAGYRVLGFASGEELLASPELARADAIILDVGLPALSGADVARELHARRDTRAIPVLMVSGAPAEEISANVVTWLMKPLAVDDLLDAVKAALAAAAPRPRVLLVEDDLDLARVLVESFERIGAESRHAATGREAIECARAATPDLIVLDLSLPDLDGFGVVDYFKDHGLMTSVPLVVYSSNEPTPSERDRLRLGPTDFLTKSRVSPEAFEAHIARVLSGVHDAATELSHVA